MKKNVGINGTNGMNGVVYSPVEDKIYLLENEDHRESLGISRYYVSGTGYTWAGTMESTASKPLIQLDTYRVDCRGGRTEINTYGELKTVINEEIKLFTSSDDDDDDEGRLITNVHVFVPIESHSEDFPENSWVYVLFKFKGYSKWHIITHRCYNLPSLLRDLINGSIHEDDEIVEKELLDYCPNMSRMDFYLDTYEEFTPDRLVVNYMKNDRSFISWNYVMQLINYIDENFAEKMISATKILPYITENRSFLYHPAIRAAIHQCGDILKVTPTPFGPVISGVIEDSSEYMEKIGWELLDKNADFDLYGKVIKDNRILLIGLVDDSETTAASEPKELTMNAWIKNKESMIKFPALSWTFEKYGYNNDTTFIIARENLIATKNDVFVNIKGMLMSVIDNNCVYISSVDPDEFVNIDESFIPYEKYDKIIRKLDEDNYALYYLPTSSADAMLYAGVIRKIRCMYMGRVFEYKDSYVFKNDYNIYENAITGELMGTVETDKLIKCLDTAESSAEKIIANIPQKTWFTDNRLYINQQPREYIELDFESEDDSRRKPRMKYDKVRADYPIGKMVRCTMESTGICRVDDSFVIMNEIAENCFVLKPVGCNTSGSDTIIVSFRNMAEYFVLCEEFAVGDIVTAITGYEEFSITEGYKYCIQKIDTDMPCIIYIINDKGTTCQFHIKDFTLK